MVFRSLLSKAAPIARGIATTSVRNSGHHEARSVVGSNLPFSLDNRYRLMVTFILYFASGIGLPFLSLRYVTIAKSSG